MTSRLTEKRLVLATHNQGKLREIIDLLHPLGIDVSSSGALGLDEPVEDGASFAANAAIKADAACKASGLPALADDSGLAVDGLDGAPGIHSARWAGETKDFKRAMAKVRDDLEARFGSFEEADRRASFITVLCLAWPDGHKVFARGEVQGMLIDPPRGQGGFGYDAMFQPLGHDMTFGEMQPAEKRALSHRSRAFDQLLATCFA